MFKPALETPAGGNSQPASLPGIGENCLVGGNASWVPRFHYLRRDQHEAIIQLQDLLPYI